MISQSRRLNTDPNHPDFYQDPYKTYTTVQSCPVFFWEQYAMWCVASFDEVNTILRDRRFARVMPEKPHNTEEHSDQSHLTDFRAIEKFSLLNLEGSDHTRLRSLVNHAFISRKINSLRSEIKELSQKKLETIQHLGRADLLETYAASIPATIIARMLGIPDQHVPDLLKWSHSMVKVYTLTQSRQDECAANRAAKEFNNLLRTLIQSRRDSPCNDLLTDLIEAKIEGTALTDQELVSVAVLLLNAGHEATVHQTGNAIKTLLECKFEPDSLFNTPEQTSLTLTELMRFDAPLHLFTRYALEDVSIDGVDIKRGDQIALLLGAANRDPKRFQNPDTFDPWRKDAGHVSLGAGTHYCVGAILAKLELEITVPLVFRELKNLRLASAPSYQNTYHFHGLEKLDVRWTPP